MGLFVSQINNANKTNFVQPNFKAKNYLYHEIKRIPHTPCACCGRELIRGEDAKAVYARITLPLIKMIKEGFLNRYKKFPEIWEAIINLANKDKSASFDKLMCDAENFKYIKEIIVRRFKTPEVLKQMRKDAHFADEINNKIDDTFKDIELSSRTVMKKSSAVMKALAKFKPNMSGHKLEAFEQMEIYAAKYPDLRLSEILEIGEIRDFHMVKDFLQRAEAREKTEFHFANIENMIKKAVPDITSEELEEVKNSVIERFSFEKDEAARPFLAKQDYRKLLEKYNCLKLEKKINAEIDKIPRKYLTKDSFLYYASNHNYYDSLLTSAFVVPASSSVDHQIPKSQGGTDSLGNYILMCRDCNQKKSSKEFGEFLQIHPEMTKNAKKQVSYISRFILNGTLATSCKHWPIETSKTMYDLSEGKININTKPYCKKALKLAEGRLKQYQFDIDVLADKRTYLLGRRSNIDRRAKRTKDSKDKNQLNSIDTELKKINEEIQTLRAKRTSEQEFIDRLNQIINS